MAKQIRKAAKTNGVRRSTASGRRPGKRRPKKDNPAAATSKAYRATPNPGPSRIPANLGTATCEPAWLLRLCSEVIETDRGNPAWMLQVSSDHCHGVLG